MENKPISAESSYIPARHPDAWRSRDFYRYWTKEHVRFADLDPLGHVNNNSFGIYFEAARTNFFQGVYPNFWTMPILVVLRAINIEFHHELHYPNDLEIGIRPLRIGTTSFSGAMAVFTGDVCHAAALSTAVMIDRETRVPSPVPDALRAGFLRYQ